MSKKISTRKNSRKLVGSRLYRILASLLIVLLLVSTLPAGRGEPDKYVSHPANMPDFSDFRTPRITPGNEKTLTFNIRNRYKEEIEDFSLEISLHRYATTSKNVTVDKISNPPKLFKSENEGGTTSLFFNFTRLGFNETKEIIILIKSQKSTPEGSYNLKMRLQFRYLNRSYLMLSRSFFAQKEWDDATGKITDVERNYFGNINLSKLGCDGIVPETAFSVKTLPFPDWGQYFLLGLAAFAGILAITYLIYETNASPRLNKTIQYLERRFKQWRRLYK